MAHEHVDYSHAGNPESGVPGWSHYNTGVFGSGHHEELDFQGEPLPNPFEHIALQAIDYYLRTHTRVAAVDLGSMLGMSMTVLGYYFQHAIEERRLQLIATVQEKEYTIEHMIAEAARRLTVQDEYTALKMINRKRLQRDEIDELDSALQRTQLFLSAGELRFLQRNHHLVRYITNVESENLPVILKNTADISTVHLLHEFNAGLTFAHNRRKAIKTIAEIMSPDGTIISTVKWHRHPDSAEFRILESYQVSAHDIPVRTKAQDLSYTLFSFPDAPRLG